MNENEKIMSDISYTAKDFNSVYSELLDTAKKLTNKWDPSLSNESDPGVLLLKLNAIIADKNNYNIDKNVLECFPLSVTQQSNARKLYDLLGYNMHWYRSATSSVIFQILPGTDLTSSTTSQTLQIPLWTQLTNKDKSICYTTLKNIDLVVNKDTSTVNNIYSDSIPIIEGTIHEFDVNGNTELTIDNLDENSRLYFNETRIAENGVYISTQNWINVNEWERVDNLASYPEGLKIYKFGVLPNSDTCYIEFPKDVANLITSTFKVNYIITNGVEGNTKANTILYFLNEDKINDSSDLLLKDVVKIDQIVSGVGGQDIEDLDTAYKNYKRSIGTFNTLVTTQDYESKIYDMEGTADPYLVSNIVVSDRTNDLNYTNHIIQWDGSTTNRKLINKKSGTTALIQPFDLYLYMLQYSTPSTEKGYNDGFITPVSGNENDLLTSIKNNIEEVKSIQHNINSSSAISDGKSFFNNLYKLTGQVTTFHKVTKTEKSDIETNIKSALLNKYSSRNIEFGSQPDYNDLIETIKNADSRINNVILNQPEYAVECQSSQGTLNKLTADDKNELVARMVLSGNVQLFKFDDDFLYDFNQSDNQVESETNTEKETTTSDIESITTETNISVTATEPLQLGTNESLQFVAPNYITTKQYSINVNYEFSGTINIIKDQDYILPDNTSLKFTYTDSNGLPQTIPYPAGTMINSTFNISGDDQKGKITTSNSISIKEKNSKTIKYGTKYIAVLNTKHTLAASDDYILQENEYLIYTDASETNLVIVGTGTKIVNLSDKPLTLATPENIDLDKIYDSTATANWWTATENPGIELVELSIYTLGAGGTIKSTIDISDINNTYQPITLNSEDDDSIELIGIDGSTQTLLPLPNDKWQVRSRLNINTNSNEPQLIANNQSFTLNFTNGSSKNITGKYIIFNYPVALSGGENVDASVITPTSTDYLRAYTYTKNADWNDLERTDGLLTISGEQLPKTSTFNFDIPDKSSVSYYLKFNVNSTSGKIIIDDNEYGAGIHYLNIISTITELKIEEGTGFAGSDTVSFDYITKIDGYNTDEINVEKAYSDSDNYSIAEQGDAVKSKIKSIISNSISYDNVEPQFDWTYRVKSQDKVLQPTLSTSYFNINHIYNNYTIAQIDTKNSNIEVNPYYVS